MEIDDIPPQPKQLKKYTCVLCKNSFDKPSTKQLCGFCLELFIFIIVLVAGSLLLGPLGVFVALVMAIILSVIRMLTKKKVCPFCKSENFVQNYK